MFGSRQRLGYSGFTELKMAVVDLIDENLEERRGGNAGRENLRRMSSTQSPPSRSNNIRRTVAGIDQETFRRAARALAEADHVYACGVGISSFLVDLMCYILRQIGIRAVALSGRGTSPCEPVVLMTAEDLVIGVSLPPYSRQTLDVLRAAADRGVRILAVTDRPTAPAARADRSRASGEERQPDVHQRGRRGERAGERIGGPGSWREP